MNSLLSNYSEKANFWKLYPVYKVTNPFKDLYKSDKSKNKINSSTLLWGILFLIDDSIHNPLANLPLDEKKDIIKMDYFEDKDINWDDYSDLIDSFRNNLYTKFKRDLIEWEIKLEERRKFIRDTPYSLDSEIELPDGKKKTTKGTAAQLDTMAANTVKIYDLMEKLENKVIAEKEGLGEVKGNRRESASESGKI